jgi:hypothetical protein
MCKKQLSPKIDISQIVVEIMNIRCRPKDSPQVKKTMRNRCLRDDPDLEYPKGDDVHIEIILGLPLKLC